MRKKWKYLIICMIAFLLALEPNLTVCAIDTFGYQDWPYLYTTNKQNLLIDVDVSCGGNRYSVTGTYFMRICLPEDASDMTLTPAEYYYPGTDETALEHYSLQVTPSKETADYSRIQEWTYTDVDRGNSFVVPVLAYRDYSGQEATLNRLEVYERLAPRLIEVMKQYTELFRASQAEQNSGGVQVGKRHTCDLNLIHKLASRVQGAFGVTLTWPENHKLWVNSTGWTDEDALEQLLDYWNGKYKDSDLIKQGEAEYLEQVLDSYAPYYLNYLENHRIQEPVITGFSVNGTKGIIDEENQTVYLKLPDAAELPDNTQPEVETPDSVKANYYAGKWSEGLVYYSVVPYDVGTGTTYDGVQTSTEGVYEYGVNLARTWKILIESGEPYHQVTEFSVVTEDGVRRAAQIDEESGTITLRLPYGTDLTQIQPRIVHTGTSSSMDGQILDFSDGKAKTLTIVNDNYHLTKDYQVMITAEKSDENRILSYRIGGTEASVTENTVTLMLPYGTVLAEAEVEMEISEFASVKVSPSALSWGDNIYIITSQSGIDRTYTVKLTETSAASGNSILSFSYGGARGVIDSVNGTILLELPAGSSLSFAPKIELSPYATVEPASGVVQDFTDPVTYVVTSQRGTKNRYTVRVEIGEEQQPNPYKDQMQSLLDKIVNRYGSMASDDWEWLVEGIAQGQEANAGGTFDLAASVGKLDSTTNVAFTNLDRKVMSITARGYDCSNLAQYNGGNPLTDAKGNQVDDLVSLLYNYKGTYTINGPIFALIALDTGNYSVPSDAVWTRDALLEKILNHVYLSDGFDTDMVAMLMYSIAPYRDDAVYGARVRQKLEEGVEIIQDRMGTDYSFDSWGAKNSETASQVICALSACGIDCHTDPRFSNGTDSVLTSWLQFADFESGYFSHTDATPKNAMATYQGAYTLQWYLGFLNHGGAGKPYDLYKGMFNYASEFGAEAEIRSFVLEGQEGVIDTENATVTVTLPRDTPLERMEPELILSDGAKLLSPELPFTFVENTGHTFVVQAEDGVTKKSWTVTVIYGDIQAAGSELKEETIILLDANQREVEILDRNVNGTDILLTVSESVDPSKLRLKAEISAGAKADLDISGGTVYDFSQWSELTVVSEDGRHESVWRIKVQPEKSAQILSFRLQISDQFYDGVIDGTTVTISGVPYDADVTAATPDIELSEGANVLPLPGVPQDFTKPVIYTASGSGLKTRDYTVIVSKEGTPSNPSEPSDTSVKIHSFTVCGVEGQIDESAKVITVTLPDGTDVTALSPQVSISAGCTVSPVSGEVVNLSEPLAYTVTNGTESSVYTVIVVLEKSISSQLWEKMEENSSIADHQVVRE